MEECSLYGRPIEPLAFYLPAFSEVEQQKQSPLYRIPKEIRDLIFEYALTDDGAPSPNSDNVFRRSAKGEISEVDSACSLLQTCKAVYLEAYRLPMQLNGTLLFSRDKPRQAGHTFLSLLTYWWIKGYLAYFTKEWSGRRDGSRWNDPSRPDLARIAPWQYALIQRIDLSLQQTSIEGKGGLQNELQYWGPALRHSGAYVSPRYYSTTRSLSSRPKPEVSAHNFALVPASDRNCEKGIKDGDKVTLERYDVETYYDPEDEIGYGQLCYVKGKFIARSMVARRLTHLTLRMSRTDWWTWGDDPSAVDSDKQLALDPACGGTIPRPTIDDMLNLATSRRNGCHPSYDESGSETWGSAIGALPDLKTFELILETFSPKKQQLENVVDCARTWKFPLKGTQYEMVCDHKIESLQWGLPEHRDGNVDGMERMSDEQNQAQDQRHPAPYTLRDNVDPAPSSASSSLRQRFRHRFFKRSREPPKTKSIAILPQWNPPASQDWVQPSQSPSLYEDDFHPEISWLRGCTEFEVRVVRFKRRRAD
ncbi:uncharacterized protein N0V89_001281 [Didymosphaeria variabile]|uniref:F-box domain-containing protein n=1 Tax=Didymosphaeria variabile TaxID=1932322 RepID=A0A9W8XVZ1_9PLEO|nr:uncharacterized protein N0V89_001281 [Didymosphaeria variabile]KAJ4360714.1 hypothetical protein N0V89_001281 [Didymosphaeria variabile]